MNLAFLRNEVNDYTGAASSSCRQLAFAGIAIIWILTKQDTSTTVSNWVLWFFVASLACDLMQYVSGFIVYKFIDIHKQNELQERFKDTECKQEAANKIESEDFEIASIFNWPMWTFLILKVVMLLVGYCGLLTQLPFLKG